MILSIVRKNKFRHLIHNFAHNFQGHEDPLESLHRAKNFDLDQLFDELLGVKVMCYWVFIELF